MFLAVGVGLRRLSPRTYRKSRTITSHAMLGMTAVQLIGWGGWDSGAEIRSKSTCRTLKPHVLIIVQSCLPAPGEDETAYWLGEGNFGDDWGEGGYFRWVRGEDPGGWVTNYSKTNKQTNTYQTIIQ